MRLVAIESPWHAIAPWKASAYLESCIADCLERGESPYASHQMLTGVLDDDDPKQREQGIVYGFAWADKADARVVYQDLGVSPGMQRGIERAAEIGQIVEYRTLGKGWSSK